jgi:hypothetical protein
MTDLTKRTDERTGCLMNVDVEGGVTFVSSVFRPRVSSLLELVARQTFVTYSADEPSERIRN